MTRSMYGRHSCTALIKCRISAAFPSALCISPQASVEGLACRTITYVLGSDSTCGPTVANRSLPSIAVATGSAVASERRDSLASRVRVTRGKALRAEADIAARSARTQTAEELTATLRRVAELERFARRPSAVRRILGQLEFVQLIAVVAKLLRERTKFPIEARLLAEMFASLSRRIRVSDILFHSDGSTVSGASASTSLQAISRPSFLPFVEATPSSRLRSTAAVANALTNISTAVAENVSTLDAKHMHVVADALVMLPCSAMVTQASVSAVAEEVEIETTHKTVGTSWKHSLVPTYGMFSEVSALQHCTMALVKEADTRFDDLPGDGRVSIYECAHARRVACRSFSRWVAASRRAAAEVLRPIIVDGGRALMPAYAKALASIGLSSLGSRHTRLLLRELGLAAEGDQLSNLQAVGASMIEQTAVTYGRGGGTSCYIRCRYRNGKLEEKVVHSGETCSGAGGMLAAVPLRVRRDKDAEFVALSEALVDALRRDRCRPTEGKPAEGIDIALHVGRAPCLSCIGAMAQMKAFGANVSVSFDAQSGWGS
eukprot:TRINITY_DN63209_c0_g1_i1.p1 TRINITY_DN63209_c0_g1~~TRINITY_DN63209_c0_g1_i1.p1  ORF type:complete len:560 (+),score=73.39 TRINITY_DN63209_c0_g1_i1:40-1680(+)